ncbi:hypothetical protein LMH87_004649 [Akanthomyces muscarius]|uniref:Uncharacterized protein n=1 Tax=Akanthomyces muscarius TaxID=2231603 RepID=A0A9W8UH85_AKAMU|nr:hypothetical protein LMH87_004649 [Akanthomyces muscarius]KAJ4145816.1 hypothetical protein LMH87_004649 [Akanthomyces muscarius]
MVLKRVTLSDCNLSYITTKVRPVCRERIAQWRTGPVVTAHQTVQKLGSARKNSWVKFIVRRPVIPGLEFCITKFRSRS